jgi:hypothetical protein
MKTGAPRNAVSTATGRIYGATMTPMNETITADTSAATIIPISRTRPIVACSWDPNPVYPLRRASQRKSGPVPGDA